MSPRDLGWLLEGQGVESLSVGWTVAVDAPLADLSLARETGQVLAADVSGGLYLFNRLGRAEALTRLRHSIRKVALCDTGRLGVITLDDANMACIDSHLGFAWQRELPDTAVSLAVTPYGTHFAVGLANGKNAIVTNARRKLVEFESMRPLVHLQFLHTQQELIGASDHGLFARYDWNGQTVWSEKLWSAVGDVAATGDGRAIVIAGFTHGLQVYDEDGKNLGTLVVDGTANLVSLTYAPKRIVATTVERHLFGLNQDGQLAWIVKTPEDVVELACAPLGDWFVVGFASGRLMRINWG